MRLAVYTDAIERGGAEISLRTLLAALDPSFDVTVLGVTGDVVHWIAAARPETGTVVLPPVRNKRHLLPIVSHLRAIRRLRPDVFHANLRHPWSCQYGLAAALLARGTKVVAVEHALIPPHRPLQRTLKRLTSRRLAAHVTVGRRAAHAFEELIGLPSGSMRVIYTGVHLAEAEPSPSVASEGLVVGCLGRFSPEKGLDVLLRALVSLDGVTAVFVGDGPERARLEQLARELGVADRVALPGWQDEPASYVRSFDVLVSPSHSEALPLALLEGMLAGLPVVATNVGSVSEAVVEGETGLLVEPDDAAALAAAIRKLQGDRALALRMGERGRELVRSRFTPEAMAQAFEALYAEILAGDAAGSEPAQASPA
jgi:glycosyltransferase involved in cell wall biosynthesis